MAISTAINQVSAEEQPIGLVSRGTINSLITTPETKWIATGNWSMNVNNGSLSSFETNMTWLNSTGTAAHTHEFLNFRVQPEKVISLQQPGNNIFLKGLMDVGTNNRIVWRDVPSNVSINGKNTIIISVDDKATNHHFAAQPVLGVVKSFILCSDIPGPNMEVLPPCTPDVQTGTEQVSNTTTTSSSSAPTSLVPSASTNVTTGELTYENATLGLKLNYPSNWVIRQGSTVNPTLAIAVILFPPDDNTSAFTIGIQELQGENKITSITDYANNTIARYRQEVNNFQPTLFNTNDTLSGNPAYEIDGSYTDPNSQERVFFEIGTLQNNKVYVFQFDSPKSLSVNYLSVVSKILQSVQIKPTASNPPETPAGTMTDSSIPTTGPCRNVTIDKVSASGFEKDPKDYNPPEHAIDGDSSTWWSNKAIPSWFQLELGEPVQTCSVNIAWNKGDERMYDFTIAKSTDGQSFTDIYTGKSTGNSSSYETYDLGNSPSNTKFLKISVTGSSSKAGWVGIRDVSVQGR
ncbi:MAG: discoidin domain-containing protein [Nitrososphaerota archaeon]